MESTLHHHVKSHITKTRVQLFKLPQSFVLLQSTYHFKTNIYVLTRPKRPGCSSHLCQAWPQLEAASQDGSAGDGMEMKSLATIQSDSTAASIFSMVTGYCQSLQTKSQLLLTARWKGKCALQNARYTKATTTKITLKYQSKQVFQSLLHL